MNERRTRILFVDDESNVLSSIRRLLRSESSIWEIFTADSVDRGIECIQADEIDLVVSDFNMPEKDGLELLGWITENYSLNTVPFIMLTGNAEHDLKRRAINAGAIDLLNKPIMKEDLLARLRNAIKVRDYQKSLVDLNAELENRVEERTKELESSRNELLWRLAYATEARDDVTGTHIDSVARLTKQIALSYGLSRKQVDCIHLASMLHDIGKIAIPDSILLKPGKLTDDERKHMETHCKSGWDILTRPTNIDGSSSGPNQLLECAADVALSHHEYWDGTGYPSGLKGVDIPLSGRIVAAADVLDALCSRRSYKQKISFQDSFQMLAERSGTQFDPEVIEACTRCYEQLRSIVESVGHAPTLDDSIKRDVA